MFYANSNIIVLCLLTFCILLGKPSHAEEPAPRKIPLTWQDLKYICDELDTPFASMILLLHHENGFVGHERKNTDGSWDYGPFQVNSIHLQEPYLKDFGITAEQLQYNGPINALAATIIFKLRLNRAKSLYDAIGSYHSYTPKYKKKYQADFTRRIKGFKNVQSTIAWANMDFKERTKKD